MLSITLPTNVIERRKLFTASFLPYCQKKAIQLASFR